MRIAIIGAAELGRLIAKHIENDSTNEIVGFYDDFKKDALFLNYKICGNIEKLLIDFDNGMFDAAIIGIGFNGQVYSGSNGSYSNMERILFFTE
jgi:predicted dinucleotide-utilizing enzyme